MLFHYVEHGGHTNIPAQQRRDAPGRSKNVTQMCYYAHRFHARPGVQPTLFRSGKLFQQYIVDAWASTEQSALNWARIHQKELRADVYSGLRDAAVGDGVGEATGSFCLHLILEVIGICFSCFKTL